MKLSHLFTLILIAALCLAFTSCIPNSESPLSSVKDAHTDPALVGDWLDKNDQETYHITAKDSGWMHVDVLKAGAKTDSYDFFPTKIGDNTFANVVVTNKGNSNTPAKAYTFIRYSIAEKGVLKMWSMSSDATAAAVKTEKLKGTILSKDKDPDVVLTSSTTDLEKFIQNADLDALFKNKATLVLIELTDK